MAPRPRSQDQYNLKLLHNGYHNEVHLLTDDVVRKKLTDGTRANYDMMMREWKAFVTIARDGELRSPYDIRTAKAFVLFFIMRRNGRGSDGQRCIKRSYVYAAWRWFMAAWSREHATAFPGAVQDSIFHYIHEEADVDRVSEVRRNFTLGDLHACMRCLWTADWHEYHHERYRVGLHLLILLHAFTSARRGEFESKLKYKDVTLALVTTPKGSETKFIMQFKRVHTKGSTYNDRIKPSHVLYDNASGPFWTDPLALFLAVALCDEALRDYHSWQELRDIPAPPPGQKVLIDWHPDKMEWYLFPRFEPQTRQFNHSNSSTSLTSEALGNLGMRTGFREKLTTHALRRELLFQVDQQGHSEAERMRVAGHTNPGTYRMSYQTDMTLVDGQSCFLGTAALMPDLHAMTRAFGWHGHDSGMTRLSVDRQRAIRDCVRSLPSCTSLLAPPSPLTEDISQPEAGGFNRAQQQVYDRTKKLKQQALKEQRRLTSPSTTESANFESDFEDTRKIMPQRDRLATTMFLYGSIRHETGTLFMDDLVHLCSTNNEHVYRTSAQADNVCIATRQGPRHLGRVAPDACACAFKSGDKQGGQVVGASANFCFRCHVWVYGTKVWTEHLETHLVAPPMKCNMLIHRGHVVRPATCPFCLGDGALPVRKRLFQYINTTQFKRHVIGHIRLPHPSYCGHPSCTSLVSPTSMDDIISHFGDRHLINFNEKERLRLRAKSTDDTRHLWIDSDASTYTRLDDPLPEHTTETSSACLDRGGSVISLDPPLASITSVVTVQELTAVSRCKSVSPERPEDCEPLVAGGAASRRRGRPRGSRNKKTSPRKRQAATRTSRRPRTVAVRSTIRCHDSSDLEAPDDVAADSSKRQFLIDISGSCIVMSSIDDHDPDVSMDELSLDFISSK